MKRNHGAVPTVALDGAESPRRSFVNLQPGAPRPRNSFSVKMARDEDDADDSATIADIYLYAEIGESWWGDSITANAFIKALKELGDGVEQINLHINSPGGDIFDGVAIYNSLIQHKAKVVVYVDSLAASAASFIAQAGDEIIMLRGSTMMIHDGWGFAMGNAEDMRSMADILDKLSNNIASIYAARTGEPMADWRAVMQAEAWYTAEEAVEAGLADRVWSDKKAEKASALWDLSVFNFAGRETAPSPELVRQSAMLNRLNKETPVGTRTVKNVEVTPPVVEPEGAPEGTEEEAVEPEPVTTTEAEPVPPVTPPEENLPSDATQVVAQARSMSVLVNGVATSDVNAIQRHINTLEGFVNESRDTARKNFVQKLSDDGKIVGAMVESMQAHVLTLNDEQYKNFTQTYENAPQLPMFARHGAQATTSTTADKARADRIEVLQGMIEHHRNSGASEEDIKKMGSYAELQTLLAMSDGQTS